MPESQFNIKLWFRILNAERNLWYSLILMVIWAFSNYIYLANSFNSIVIEMHNDMFRISQTQNPKSLQEMGSYNPTIAISGLPLA